MREIKDPFVVAPPSGARVRDRLRLTDYETAAVFEIGSRLGSQARADLMWRVSLGEVKAVDNQRTERKRALTAATSSRWAGAITRSSEDQYKLSMRALRDDITSLRRAIKKIESRLPVEVGADNGKNGKAKVSGYATRKERFAKQQRLDVLKTRLRRAEARLALGRPSIVKGSKRLLKTRHNLNAAGITEQKWRQQWEAKRLFLTADGESGKAWGNETIRVTADGTVTIRVPAALTNKYGTHLTLTNKVTFSNRREEWLDRVSANQSVRYDITLNPDRNRWYIDASWGINVGEPPSSGALLSNHVLAVDVNADHLAAWVVDPAGNPVGDPISILTNQTGSTDTRDGHLREAISRLLQIAERNHCRAVVIENLGFIDARQVGRETMGRGTRGKEFRRTVAGIPTGNFRDRLAGMAVNRGMWVIAVDPAYTSKWGGKHWQKPLNTRTSGHVTVTRHMAAAVVIGRRAQGYGARRRSSDPGRDQRITSRESADRAVPVMFRHGPDSPVPPQPQPHRGQKTGTGPAGSTRTRLSTPFGEPQAAVLTATC